LAEENKITDCDLYIELTFFTRSFSVRQMFCFLQFYGDITFRGEK